MQNAIKIFAPIWALLGIFGFFNQTLAQNDSGLWARQEGIETIGSEVFGQNQPSDVRVVVLQILQIALSFLGLVFLALILVAGFKWMTAQGNDAQIKEATKHITNAVIGLIIILSAWGITTFILIRVKLIAQGNPNFNNPTYYEYNNSR